jgi:hypothetical protein
MGLMSVEDAEKGMTLLAELSRRMRKKYFTAEGAEKE